MCKFKSSVVIGLALILCISLSREAFSGDVSQMSKLNSHIEQGKGMDAWLKIASRGGRYEVPSATQVAQAEGLFYRSFEHIDDQLSRQWSGLGFEVVALEDAGELIYVIREIQGALLGRGFYLFRPHASSNTVLQAPHSFKDLGTREIVLKLMHSGRFKAAAFNSVPRHYWAQGEKVDADLAHLKQSYFLAFSRAYSRAFKQGTLIQVHGFAQHKRRTQRGAISDMIISSGRRVVTPTVTRIAACLNYSRLGNLSIYPNDTPELGGTTNSSSLALAASGHQGFVHLELSKPLRRKLQRRQHDVYVMAECLGR
ncbi:MAG: hypothetical protein Q9M31_07705 [Mariprofundus sp.]|nr:hypothetical protein [Mariprofundus sp.]